MIDLAEPASARGLLMGNRGSLHGTLVDGTSRAGGLVDLLRAGLVRLRADPMPPGRWTALFLLDEATALAAGHRPWGTAGVRPTLLLPTRSGQQAGMPSDPELSRWTPLHAERVDPRSRRRTSPDVDRYVARGG